MLLKGLRFGMLLQLAVGPLCLLVFETAAVKGAFAALPAVAAIAIVDALYIALSCFGVAALLQKESVRTAVKWIGCITLALFGLDSILGALRLSLLPQISLFAQSEGNGVFLKALLLTASNPLTILFWGGVLSAQTAAHGYTRAQLVPFSAGCVGSTLLFLTAIAFIGGLAGDFLPGLVIRMLNMIVGAALIYFGVRLVVKKETPKPVECSHTE